MRNAFARWHRLTTTVWSTRAGKRPDAVECDGRAQGASLLSTHRLAYCPYGLACFSARPARKTSCWTSALRRASQHDRSKEAGCGKHHARAGLTCSFSTGQLVVSDKLPVRRLSAARPEVFNGCMQLRLRHLDQCSAWVKICEVINYGQNKSVGNAPWSAHGGFWCTGHSFAHTCIWPLAPSYRTRCGSPRPTPESLLWEKLRVLKH